MFQKINFSFLKLLLVMLLAHQLSINCYLMDACLECITEQCLGIMWQK